MIRPPPSSPLFPYTTLFRSNEAYTVLSDPEKRAHFDRFGTVGPDAGGGGTDTGDRKSTRLNSSHTVISYAVFCLKKKKHNTKRKPLDTSGMRNGRQDDTQPS